MMTRWRINMEQNSLDTIWQALAQENKFGTHRRLHSKKKNVRVSATYKCPESYYGIAFSFSTDKKKELRNLKQLEELHIIQIDD